VNDEIIIPRRFSGPPDSANGGYACGVIASHIGMKAEVTLRRPPPLDTPMRVERVDDSVTVLHGDEVVAEATRGWQELAVRPPVSFDEAVAAAERSWITEHPDEHPFPTCFTCGPRREYPDGQRVFVGPVPDRDVAAAPWVAHKSLATRKRIAPEIVWAVLDCAGGIGSGYVHGMREVLPPHVLGRFSAYCRRYPRPGDRFVALGWRIGREGRKVFAGSALYTDEGEFFGAARATWIQLV
jgi:hypothetical protein